jgi:hypothetical protein
MDCNIGTYQKIIPHEAALFIGLWAANYSVIEN